MAFFELADNMHLAERFLKRIFRDVLAHCPEDMQFFDERIDKTRAGDARRHRRQRFRAAAVHRGGRDSRRSRARRSNFPVAWGHDLQAEHERYLTEQQFKRPVILFDYPRTIKPFYMRVNDDGRTVRAMDILVPEVGEIIGGSQREERLDVLERADARAGARSREPTGGISTCGATARCRTPASAWGWSGSCSSSPAWPTSAT